MGNYEELLDNLKQFDDTKGDIAQFFQTMLYEIGWAHTEDITPYVFLKPAILKSHLAQYLSKSCRFLCDRRSDFDSLRKNIDQLLIEHEKLIAENQQLKEEKIQLQTSTIQSQDSVIRLQDELLKCKDEKLKGVSAVVEKAVQQSVKTEIQTYSQVVEKSAPKVTVKSVKTAIKEKPVEEDCNRSLVIFGLEEEKGEQL